MTESVATLAELRGPDGASIRIRHASVDDAGALLAYLSMVGAESPYLSFGAEGPILTENDERIFLARVAECDNTLAIVAEWNGRIVGSLSFVGGSKPRMRHIGEMGISVARVCWGVGLGRRLMELLIDWALRSGIVRKINLIVRTDNDRAIALYESLGFVIEGRIAREIVVDGEFHDSYLMGRLID